MDVVAVVVVALGTSACAGGSAQEGSPVAPTTASGSSSSPPTTAAPADGVACGQATCTRAQYCLELHGAGSLRSLPAPGEARPAATTELTCTDAANKGGYACEKPDANRHVRCSPYVLQ